MQLTENQKTIKEILKLFIWREDVIARMGKHAPMPVYEMTPERLDDALTKHVLGEERIGAYTTKPDDTIKWLCLDIDGAGHAEGHSMRDPNSACQQISNLLIFEEIPHYTERSASGSGFHVWVFFEPYAHARDARHWIQTRFLARLSGLKLRDGQPYDWTKGKGIEIYPKQDEIPVDGLGNLVWLPWWGGDEGRALYSGHFFRKVEAPGLVEHRLTHRAPEPVPDTPERAKKYSQDSEEIRRMLDYLDPGMPHDDWIKVGMALHSWSAENGHEEGFALWDDWSKAHSSYDEKVIKKKWRSFRNSKAKTITLGTLKYMARDAGMPFLKEGTQAEMARYVLRRSEIFDGVNFYNYNEGTSLWSLVPEWEIKARVVALDGYAYGKTKSGDPKRIRISNSTADGVTALCKVLAERHQPSVWDASLGGIAVQNGWLTACGLEPLQKDHMARNALPYTFREDAECPSWDKYLSTTVEKDTAALLQEFAGASMLGIAWQYQAALFLFGEGANGKSVAMDVIRGLFDPNAVSAAKITELGDRGTKGGLEGKRINIQAELPDTELLEGSDFKDLVTGDLISVRLPYDKELTTFRCVCGFLFSGNQYPRTSQHSHGFWRRVKIASFDRIIREEEMDRTLSSRILRDEMNGVLRWAWEGAKRLRQRGQYTNTLRGDQRLTEWVMTNDPFSLFLTECCHYLPSDKAALKATEDLDWTPSSQLYSSYKSWCELSGKRPCNATKFGSEMGRLIRKHRFSSGVQYAVKLAPTDRWQIGTGEAPAM